MNLPGIFPTFLLGGATLIFAPCLRADNTLFLDRVIPQGDIVVTSDVWYGEGNPNPSQPLYLDVYQPHSPLLPEKRPALVYIHGGAFTQGDKADQPAPVYCHQFAQRGYLVVSINYTLDGTLGSASQDAATAIRWLRNHAAAYQVDPDRIIVGGHSAGGATSLNIGALEAADLGGAGAEVAGVLSTAGSDFVDLSKFDLNDPPMFVINGDADGLSPVANARNLIDTLDRLESEGVTFTYSYMEPIGAGHSFLPGNGNGRPLPQPIASPQDRIQGWSNTEIGGKTVERHCFEFFFEHLNLIAVLAESSKSLERSFGIPDGSGVFRMSIQQDSRIGYQLRSSPDLTFWSAADQEPTINGTLLEVDLPLTSPIMFHQWKLLFDYREITSDDYETF